MQVGNCYFGVCDIFFVMKQPDKKPAPCFCDASGMVLPEKKPSPFSQEENFSQVVFNSIIFRQTDRQLY